MDVIDEVIKKVKKEIHEKVEEWLYSVFGNKEMAMYAVKSGEYSLVLQQSNSLSDGMVFEIQENEYKRILGSLRLSFSTTTSDPGTRGNTD